MTPKEIRQLAKDLASDWSKDHKKQTVALLNATAEIIEARTYFAALNAVTALESITP